jgi:putative FmdB family regulatory protein
MPLYEYECESCGATFEVIQKFSDHSVDTCRTCGGKVRRLLSAPAIQFKGTGWYITDYARKGADGSEKGTEKETEKGAEKEKAGSASTESSAASTTPASGAEAKSAGSTPSTPATSSPATTSSSDKK